MTALSINIRNFVRNGGSKKMQNSGNRAGFADIQRCNPYKLHLNDNLRSTFKLK